MFPARYEYCQIAEHIEQCLHEGLVALSIGMVLLPMLLVYGSYETEINNWFVIKWEKFT